ncbi:winged helix-turn-helix domain-containing protein [Winogradskyella maritima]|uniref:Winged helix-turn-helix domain-containing protein n=1 Tax=Winogradskyella maritima TaxID=1517766 RepID=A0ABV8AJ15_9FLAO|nr:winged helix-turn-helix domain-containing protein [Winogradskyella maritima]
MKFKIFVCSILIGLVVGCAKSSESFVDAPTAKVVLRQVGHELLLSENDSISRVKEVVQLTDTRFEIQFENSLAFDPANLETIASSVISKSNVPQDYLLEVVECDTDIIAYSFLIKAETSENIVPCGGRIVPKACYTIQVLFQGSMEKASDTIWFYILVLLQIGFLAFVYISRYLDRHNHHHHDDESFYLGEFMFLPNENKLIREAQEIQLSNKEVELLNIFTESINSIVKREELVKRVWEDHGVVVGRSLDTYISKLRKKLSTDPSIKISNVHGVGYKLEIS